MFTFLSERIRKFLALENGLRVGYPNLSMDIRSFFCRARPRVSPLRYPGGKTRARGILTHYVETEYPGRRTLLSPFLGGGSFELSRMDAGYRVYGNDLFAPLATFWSVLKSNPRALQDAVRAALPVSKEDFYRARTSILSMTDPLAIATAYFLVNRCSFSGSTFCGGYSRESAEKRLTASAIDRLGYVELSQLTVSSQDACEFLRRHPETEDTVVYADPPYVIESYLYGKDGDLHEAFDHAAFAAVLKTRRDWILSYNDCPLVRELYAGCRILKATWAYGMDNGKKTARELIILPGTM
jgi:DNA adenine methylase